MLAFSFSCLPPPHLFDKKSHIIIDFVDFLGHPIQPRFGVDGDALDGAEGRYDFGVLLLQVRDLKTDHNQTDDNDNQANQLDEG
jgi:hypothetical protein